LFTGVTLDLILSKNSLRPLVGFRGEPHVTPELPTWAVDFVRHKYSSKKRPWNWWNHSHHYKVFAAAGNNLLACGPFVCEPVLPLRGVFVDTIATVGKVLGEEIWDDLPDDLLVDTILGWKQQLELFLSSREMRWNYVSGCSWTHAFWRTMLGDLIISEYPLGRPFDF
jgi:hypothetical protein